MSAKVTTGATPEEDRFSFGENWLAFLDHLDDERIAEAERSLQSSILAREADCSRSLRAGSGLLCILLITIRRVSLARKC
jgi:hypothetical protein